MASNLETWLSISLYSFIFVFGTFSNILVILFFAFKINTQQRQRGGGRHNQTTTFRWFVVNLAVADGIVCVVSPALHFYLLATDGRWGLGGFLCKVFTPVGFVTVNVSAWILCAIAFERYKAIGTPFAAAAAARTHQQKRHVNILCLLMWLSSLLVTLPLFLWTDVQGGSCYTVLNRKQHLSVAIVGLLIQSVLPIVVMALCYVMIRRAFARQIHDLESTFMIRKSATESLAITDKKSDCLKRGENIKLIHLNYKKRDENNNIGYKSRQSMRVKSQMTTQTLLLAFAVFVICSLPYNIFYVVAVYMFRFGIYTPEEMLRHSDVYGKIEFWLSYLVVLNSVMNCIIYAGKFPTFRRFIFAKVFFFCNRKTRRNTRDSFRLKNTSSRETQRPDNQQLTTTTSNDTVSMRSPVSKTTVCPFNYNETPTKELLHGMELLPIGTEATRQIKYENDSKSLRQKSSCFYV